ncbi:MAG: TetR family transcriptional regulator [Mucilaginibacter sp.]|nr:TetR family transcriptional regulator [Mucilaginibacter sp.]
MKEKIIEGSLQQFLEHGIQKITLQKLIVHLNISAETMHKYFDSKEQLLEECLKVYYKQADKGVLKIIDGAPNVVVSICRIYSKAIDVDFGDQYLFNEDLNYYYPDLQDKIIKEYSKGALEILTGLTEHGIIEGYFFHYLKATDVLQAITILYRSVTRYDVYKEFSKKRELTKHTIAIYLKSICTDKGLQVMDQLNVLSD